MQTHQTSYLRRQLRAIHWVARLRREPPQKTAATWSQLGLAQRFAQNHGGVCGQAK